MYVDSDNVGGAEKAARHLRSIGRRVIATVAGPPDMSAGIDRLEGFRTGMAGEFRAALVEHGDFTEPGGRAATERLLDRAGNLDGLFVASDLMAVGALQALHAAGRRVPEEVAVVGFDDNPMAATTDPPLNTVRQDPVAQGRGMVRLYLSRHRPDIVLADSKELPDVRTDDRVILPVSLVVRATA